MYTEAYNFGHFTMYIYFSDGDVVTTNSHLGYLDALAELDFYREYFSVKSACLIDSETGELCIEFRGF